ncbi:mitochondrial protein [Russula earlei]|uniref:Mitochondrial protein n=1 Tax=Russula earlei TaxID=71964 RepID=A0ACC0U7M0_9AGAM|nr:mitochondrial protein [Russula earlei]
MFGSLLRRITARTGGSRLFVSSSFLGTARTLRNFTLAATLGSTAYTFGAFYPPTLLTYIAPRVAPPPPDPDLPETQAYVAGLEEQLQKLPILLNHRERGDAEEWYEIRPYRSVPEETRVNNLTAGALRGPGRLALHPLVRARMDDSEALIIVHVGRGLCGHDGIVHGGLLATLLDESLARTAMQNLPDKVAVTANLDINYRAPTRADQFIVFRVRLLEAKGRKARVSATIEDLDGKILIEASGVFVQPRYAKLLNKTAVLERLGAKSTVEQATSRHGQVLPRSVVLPVAQESS